MIPSPSLSNALKAPAEVANKAWCHISDVRSHLCKHSSEAGSWRQVLVIRTEHALEPDEAADVAVKADVQVLVCVPHRYDVVQLVVEVESFKKKEENRFEKSILDGANKHRDKALMDLWLTCIVDCVPHLKTADGVGFVFGVTFKDQLKAREETHTRKNPSDASSSFIVAITDLPGLDLPPQVFELLQVQLSSPVGLKRLMGKKQQQVIPKMLF